MWFALSLALAQPLPEEERFSVPPPEGVDLDDYEGWSAKARKFDEGPAGCWKMEGTVYLRLLQDTGNSLLGKALSKDTSAEGTVSAVFDGHRWTQFHYTLTSEPEPWMILTPFWGKVAEDAVELYGPDGEKYESLGQFGPEPSEKQKERQEERMREQAEKMKEEAEEDGEPLFQATSFESLEWDSEAGEVVLREEASFTGLGKGELTTLYHFPMGQEQATKLEMDVPGASLGRWPLVAKVKRGNITIIGHPIGDEVLPLAQRFSGLLGAFGQTFGADSAITFTTAQRCTSTAVESPPEAKGSEDGSAPTDETSADAEESSPPVEPPTSPVPQDGKEAP